MTKHLYQTVQSGLLLVTTLVFSLALYFGFVNDLAACPLCLMQRACAFLFGFFCLIGLSLSSLARARSIAMIQLGMAIAGLYFSGRQLWLQALPVDASAVCMPGVEALLHYFSGQQLLEALFWGTGDCAEVAWRWFGLSMPAWSALYFGVMFLISLIVFLKLRIVIESKPS